jgi:hypothetical protein
MNRRSLANAIDDLDEQISELNAAKRDAYQTYREDLAEKMTKGEIKSELESLRIAIRCRREWAKDASKVQERDALVDEILAEIQRDEISGTVSAPKDNRARIAHEGNPPPAAPLAKAVANIFSVSLGDVTGFDSHNDKTATEADLEIPPFLKRERASA